MLAMTASRNSMSLWLAAISTVLLLGSCAENAPPAKSPSGQSATGPDSDSSGAKSSSKADAVEEDETDEVTGPAKTTSSDKKDKPGKDGAAAPVDDSRTTESIRKIINDNRPAFKKCYEDERKKAQDLKGTVVLELTMDGDGKLTSSGVNAEESTIKVRAVTDCIVKVAQGLKYPPSSKGLDKDFRYQFGFNNH